MAGLSRNGFVPIASGGMSLCIRLREKMETHYQGNVKEQIRESYQPETQIPLTYSSDFIFEEKERIFKDIYPAIKMFDRLVYEARKEYKLENNKLK